jgi:hypothetical protein
MTTENQRIAARIKLVRFLISEADKRGKTHGEKHHFHQVALALLLDIESEYVPTGLGTMIESWQVAEIVDTIPF